jgi:hypothetical protein
MRARGLRRNEVWTCSIAMSSWPAQSLSAPLMCHPRAQLGLRTRARSTNAVITPMFSPSCANARAAFAKVPGSSPATSKARLAKLAPLRASASRSSAAVVVKQPKTADRRPGEHGPIMRIALDCLL